MGLAPLATGPSPNADSSPDTTPLITPVAAAGALAAGIVLVAVLAAGVVIGGETCPSATVGAAVLAVTPAAGNADRVAAASAATEEAVRGCGAAAALLCDGTADGRLAAVRNVGLVCTAELLASPLDGGAVEDVELFRAGVEIGGATERRGPGDADEEPPDADDAVVLPPPEALAEVVGGGTNDDAPPDADW